MSKLALLLLFVLAVEVSAKKNLYIARKTPTEKKPEICIVLNSCNKYGATELNRTFWEMITHLEYYDHVPYELVWIDTHSQYRKYVVDGYQFNKHVFLDKTDGYVMTYKTIWILCNNAPWIFVIEEGMKMKSPEIHKRPFLREAIQTLTNSWTGVYGLSLAPYDCHGGADDWKVTDKNGKKLAVCNGRTRYVNGATLFRLSALQKLIDYKTSKEYNNAAKKSGFSMGHMVEKNCGDTDSECSAFFERSPHPNHSKDCRDLI